MLQRSVLTPVAESMMHPKLNQVLQQCPSIGILTLSAPHSSCNKRSGVHQRQATVTASYLGTHVNR